MNFILNGLWTVPFTYEIMWLSLVIMVCILLTLIWIYLYLGVGHGLGLFRCSKNQDGMELRCRCTYCPEEEAYAGEASLLLPDDEKDSVKSQMLMYWCLFFPWSVYLGWICVATIANVSILLVYYGVNSWASGMAYLQATTYPCQGWSIVMQSVATLLGLTMLLTRLDVTYACVIIWSLIAIATVQTDRAVMHAAYWLAGLLSLGTAVTFIWRMWRLYNWLKQQRWEPRGLYKE
jgi:hypothetical protein